MNDCLLISLELEPSDAHRTGGEFLDDSPDLELRLASLLKDDARLLPATLFEGLLKMGPLLLIERYEKLNLLRSPFDWIQWIAGHVVERGSHDDAHEYNGQPQRSHSGSPAPRLQALGEPFEPPGEAAMKSSTGHLRGSAASRRRCEWLL